MTIDILLADDHPIVRYGLRALLEVEPDFRVIGEVDDGLKAVEQVERLRPDVLVLDLMMPGLSGLTSPGKSGSVHRAPVSLFSLCTPVRPTCCRR